MHVREALAALPGVHAVDVFLTSEKAVLRYDPALVDLPAMRGAVAAAGYSAPDTSSPAEPAARIGLGDFNRRLLNTRLKGTPW